MEKPQAVIWIASYPKSGNTWVQAVTRQAGKPYGFPQDDVDVYKLQAENRSPVTVLGINEGISDVPTSLIKTHNTFQAGREPHPELGLKTAGFVYVMRNPLDVLLSYINFTRRQYERAKDNSRYQESLFLDLLGFDKVVPFEVWRETRLEDIPRANLDHALRRFTELDTGIPGVRMTQDSWLGHCRSWHKAAKKYPSVVLKYEDLLAGPKQFLQLRKLFQFSDAQIIDAVKRVNAAQRGMQYKTVFFNKMDSFYYHDFFSPRTTREFLEKFEAELRGLGYDSLYRPRLFQRSPMGWVQSLGIAQRFGR